MALSDFQSQDTMARSRRGSVTRNLGSKSITPTVEVKPKLGIAGQFVDKASKLGNQTLNIAELGAKSAAKFVANTPKYVYEGARPLGTGIARMLPGGQNDIKALKDAERVLDENSRMFTDLYKSGKMSKENYVKSLKSLSDSYQDISNDQSRIQSEADRGNVIESAANVAATILSAGRLRVSAVGKSPARRAVTNIANRKAQNQVLTSLISKNATKLEDAAMKIPAVKDLMVRNLSYFARKDAQMLAGESVDQYIRREGKELAVGMLLKRPIVYQTNIQGAQDVYNHIMEGDADDALKTSAWMATQMLSGGPLGATARGYSWLKNNSAKLAHGNESVIDNLSRGIGDGSPTQIARFLNTIKERAPGEYQEADKVFRVLQNSNLETAGKDVKRAVSNILDHYDQRGVPRASITPSMIYKDYKNWAQADLLAQEADKALGKNGKIVAVSWNQQDRQGIIDALKGAGPEFQDKARVLLDMANRPGVGWGNNQLLMNKLEKVLNDAYTKSDNVDEALDKGIKSIDAASGLTTQVPKSLVDQAKKLGFTFAEPMGERITPRVQTEGLPKVVSAFGRGENTGFDLASAPNPAAKLLARGLESAGVSPQQSTTTATRVLAQQVVADLNELSVAKNLGFSSKEGADTVAGGEYILKKLQQYIEDLEPNKYGNFVVAGRAAAPAITDVRQLHIGEIKKALDVTNKEAHAIRSAIVDAYAKVPMEFRGLGDKITDNLYKYNPLQKYYSRIQGALRYTYNPFFKTQERTETALLSRAQARAPMWNVPRAELEATTQKLDDAGIFKTGLSGEAAQDLVLGRITANITQGQKRDLAGLALTMAKQRGIPLDEMLRNHPEEIGDALRVVVQYPNKGVLNSSLARTMNLAFFPMRYNAKVTKLAAEILSREAPTVQIAVINSLFNMRDWLKSDEGIRWQSEHSDALQVFNWLTPVGSIQYGLERLTRKPDSIGELGALGGLPLGLISQMLDSQGIIKLNTPYVNPTSGDVMPKYIPETTQARGATAVGDLINSMFTYPGRILGLPGKQQTINKIVREFIDTNGEDFEKRIDTDRLTPLQQNWIRVLKGDTSEEAIDALYNSPDEGQFNWYTLPPLDLPIRTTGSESPEVERRTGLPTKAQVKATSKKEKNVALPINQQL